MPFVLQLLQSDQYIDNVACYHNGNYTAVNYTTQRGRAFVFDDEMKDNPKMKDLWIDHAVEDVSGSRAYRPYC